MLFVAAAWMVPLTFPPCSLPSESETSSSSASASAPAALMDGIGLVPAGSSPRAIAAEPATNSGWLVLMYAAWMLIRLEA